MKETWYHFILDDGTFHDVTCAESFKDAIWLMAEYYGASSEMFRKCLKGYDEADITGIVELFNHFAYTPMCDIYVVEKSIYTRGE